jgi:hypothetical protein
VARLWNPVLTPGSHSTLYRDISAAGLHSVDLIKDPGVFYFLYYATYLHGKRKIWKDVKDQTFWIKSASHCDDSEENLVGYVLVGFFCSMDVYIKDEKLFKMILGQFYAQTFIYTLLFRFLRLTLRGNFFTFESSYRVRDRCVFHLYAWLIQW